MDRRTVLEVFGFQRGYLSMLVDDIADDAMTGQPGGFVNHPAWQLGHLAFAADGVAEMFGAAKRLDKAWADKFGMGSKPVSDRSAYPSKGDLLSTLDEARGRLARAYGEAPAAHLAKPNPVAILASGLPTIAHAGVFFMVFHEGTHMGQLAAWRKRAGMPEALSSLR